MTTKGEAIAIGIAQMSTVEMSSCDVSNIPVGELPEESQLTIY